MMLQNNVNSDTVQNSRVTWEGCSVLLDINDGDRLVFSRLTNGSTLKIGNKNCSLKPLIGCPFGSTFQIETGSDGPHLCRVFPGNADGGNNVAQDKGDCNSTDDSRDNRAIVDNNKAQSLTSEDIDEMRRQGAKGDEIIEALIGNSSTFDKKTQFSQEKYKLKKQKKYAPKVLLRRPFSRSICEAYFRKYPLRIGLMRIDALSLLLSMANITTNSDVLVLDMVGGLLTGAVAERLGGSGYVCNTYSGGNPYPMDIVRIFNFNDEICRRIVRAPVNDLCSAQTSMDISQTADTSNVASDGQPLSLSVDEISLSSKSGGEEANIKSILSPAVSNGKAPKSGEKASRELLESWRENGFSSLLIAAPDVDPWSLVKDILPLLSYSASFAIYHQYLQPLAECMHNLQNEKMAIGLQISEPWLREYQVLPSRTHPCMQMSACGGYILSGTRICTSS